MDAFVYSSFEPDMAQLVDTTPQQETAVLVALSTPQQPSTRVREHLDELAFLALTLSIAIRRTFVQNLPGPHSRTFVGKGKLDEITSFVKEQQVSWVIFDDELSPSQVRNLERTLSCGVMDRTLLILNIFAMRAQTVQAKTQVALAQYQYLLPRLTRMWSHLSKQKGGSAGMRGPGEKELETDRRIVQKKITQLRKKLVTIDRQHVAQRKTRAQIIRVALVGYTNVGKSTLMCVLSKTNAYTENKLFATISSTVRRVEVEGIPFLLTDTVGFIRKLPHMLIESFKSTLDEVREADILLHVVDVANPAHEEHMQVVQNTLQEIGVKDTPTILVFNKVDQVELPEDTQQAADSLATTQQSPAYERHWPAVFVSATQGTRIETLKRLLRRQVYQQHRKIYPNCLTSVSY